MSRRKIRGVRPPCETAARWPIGPGYASALDEAAIVVITVVRKVSLKAGIGALIALVIALGLYNSRSTLANLFSDEVNHPASGAGAVTVVVTGHEPGTASGRGGAA